MNRELVIVITADGTIMVHGDDMDVELIEALETELGEQPAEGLIISQVNLCG